MDYLMPMGKTIVYLLEAFVLLFIAKQVYARVFRRVDLVEELYGRNNHALAVAVTGYFFGISLALGGALSGSSQGWQADLIGIALYGVLAIVLMVIAGFLCEKVLLPHFDNTTEIIRDQNMGTAFVEAGMHIANGLIVLAIVQGTGPIWSGIAFWLLAQVVLLLAGRLYEMITPHSIHRELERDNAAVGLAFGGLLVGMGNIISIAVAGDYAGWRAGLETFGVDVAFGFVALYLIHKLTDLLLAPGVKLGEEQVEESPNIGAGLIEAFGYPVAGDFAGWRAGLETFGVDVAFGFVALYLIHKLTDILLAPGVKLAEEQVEESPNIGAGLIEAFGYLGGSTLIVWIF